MHILLQSIGFGIVDAAILSVSAIGFSLQFGMTNVMNLAYGSLMTLGALVAYLMNRHHVSIWVGALVGSVAVGLVSLVLGLTIFRAFARRGARVFEMAIVGVALSLVLDFTLAAVSHSAIYQFSFPQGAAHHIAGMVFTTTQLTIVGVSVAAIIALETILHRTKLGIAIRAGAANPALARASGIRTASLLRLTWFISGLLCGLGGVTLALSYMSVSATTGTGYLPVILTVVVVAGIGALGFTAVAALVLGIAIEVVGGYGLAAYNVSIALGVLLVMLLIRPQGFFGQLFERVDVTA
jgi:branched-subunit amino acid ABC-type transport system permease component